MEYTKSYNILLLDQHEKIEKALEGLPIRLYQCQIPLKQIQFEEQMEKFLDGLDIPYMDAVLATSESTIQYTAWLQRYFGLEEQFSYAVALLTRNKLLFKEFLSRNQIPTLPYQWYRLQSDKEVELSFPLMIKPVFGYASLLTQRIDNEEELVQFTESVRPILEEKLIRRPDFYLPALANVGIGLDELDGQVEGTDFILEKYIENQTVYAVTGIQRDKLEAIYLMQCYPEAITGNNHSHHRITQIDIPAKVTKEKKGQIFTLLQSVVQRLGLKNVVFHAELIEGEEGELYLLEISPRPGGGYILEAIFHNTGVNLWNLSAQLALKQNVAKEIEQFNTSHCDLAIIRTFWNEEEPEIIGKGDIVLQQSFPVRRETHFEKFVIPTGEYLLKLS